MAEKKLPTNRDKDESSNTSNEKSLPIPDPKSILDCQEFTNKIFQDKKVQFFLKYNIPKEHKSTIKEDLRYFQIHKGRLFSGLEYQDEFIDYIS